MKLFFAGEQGDEADHVGTSGLRYRLLSYADANVKKRLYAYWTSDAAPEPFFLDSGAYGAMTRGLTINIHEYGRFINAMGAKCYPAASLDVIGDWRATARNYDFMIDQGVNVIPTFHYNSPEHELRRLLAKADYIALGGLVGLHATPMRLWLDKCFRVIRDYWPKKTHAFGVTAQWALERYPFYSADSSSAFMAAGMGRVSYINEVGQVTSVPWQQYARDFYEGVVVDGLSTMRMDYTAYRGRAFLNIRTQLALQRYVTDLWTNRGITW
jgi:hypothetical protein